MASLSQIPMEELLPHRNPMILIDHLLIAEPDRSVCGLAITDQSPFIEEQGVPAYVGLEYMAQAIAAHGGYQAYSSQQAISIGFLLGTPQFVSHCVFFERGQYLHIEVIQTWGEGEMRRFDCRILDGRNDEVLQEGLINVFRPANFEDFLRGTQN